MFFTSNDNGDERDDFQDIWDSFDAEIRSKGFHRAKPWSNEWEVEGAPWVMERKLPHHSAQIWVYLIPQWGQKDIMGREKRHHSIYAHIQRGKILDRMELKPRSLSSLKNMRQKAFKKIDEYVEQLKTMDYFH